MKDSIVVATALLLGCGAPSREDLPPLALEDPAGPVSLVREAKDGASGGYDLYLPARPTMINGNVWLLDVGNDQLVRFDSTLSGAHAYSREGEGPGEIQFAQDLVVSGDRVLVAESGNGRVSTFDTTGAFRATLPLAQSPRFVAALGQRLFATLDFSRHYAYAADERGRLTPHFDVPRAARDLAASDSSRYLAASPYIAGTPDGELVVLDQSILALSRFDADGRLLRAGLLPEPFRSKLLERRVANRRGFGALAESFLDTPAAKRISVDARGRLLLLFSLPDAWGFLIDLDRWSARPLLLPENGRARDLLWAASDATLDGDRLYVVSGSQLYEFAAEGWR